MKLKDIKEGQRFRPVGGLKLMEIIAPTALGYMIRPVNRQGYADVIEASMDTEVELELEVPTVQTTGPSGVEEYQISANYIQAVPDSQRFTALEEIESSIMTYTGGGSHGINLANATYILIAIRNTIKAGCYLKCDGKE